MSSAKERSFVPNHDFDKIKEALVENRASKYLGIEVLELEVGYAKLKMTISEDMTNFHGVTFGGFVFALADMAFGAASNSHGTQAVALNANISFVKGTRPGAALVAVCVEEHLTSKTGLYRVRVENEVQELVAVFEGTVYRKNKPLIEEIN